MGAQLVLVTLRLPSFNIEHPTSWETPSPGQTRMVGPPERWLSGLLKLQPESLAAEEEPPTGLPSPQGRGRRGLPESKAPGLTSVFH